VTQEQYERVIGGKNPSNFKGLQRPVETVSWDDAVKFCDRLSALPEEKAVGRVYRLPTEAEWDYACRARTTTTCGFGNDPVVPEDQAGFAKNAEGTHPVGQKNPNAWGLYDMHGNVFEWCADWHDEGYYKNSPVDDPSGPATGSDRVFRGGSCEFPAAYGQPPYRLWGLPFYRYSYLGFRVATVASA
jgi:formylglycine-generating enzyme required for sulfatase activity